MKRMKKILAMLLALTMLLGMSLTSMAEGTAPSAIDADDVTIKNVEKGAKLDAYQLIDAKYTTEGFVRYEWAITYPEGNIKVGDPVQFEKVDDKDVVVGLTDALIEYAAKNKGEAVVTVNVTDEKETTITEMRLTVGTWMILVTPPSTDPAKVYNPMVASVYYDVTESGDTAEANGEEVDAKSTWTLVTTGAYAKSTDISIEKTVIDYEYAVGEKVNYTLTSTIPSYSDEYTEVTFKITDKLIKGLVYDEGKPSVTVGGTAVKEGVDYDLTYDTSSDNFSIEFKQNYILGLANKSETQRAVVVTYSAKITEAAIEQTGENEATIEYTHKPGKSTTTKKDSVVVYTFEFDGVLQKVKEDKETPLDGAEFTLYKGSVAKENALTTWETKDGGRIYFAGLDSDNVYYIKETNAPDGYSLNEKIYKVEIEPTYGNDGKLTSYVVIVDGVVSGEITYGGTPAKIVDKVVNTRLNALPSTGGIGTTIFTVAGCGIMIAAAFFFFASRKKEN